MASDWIDEILRKGTVRVLDSRRTTVGAAAVIGDRCIVTCAHVVLAAGASRGGTVTVAPLAWTIARGATPDHLAPPLAVMDVAPEYWRSADEGDIAVLTIANQLPYEYRPLPAFGSVISGNPIRAYGFPASGSAYEIATGTVQTDVRDGPHPRVDLDAERVRPGFSGAPIFDIHQKRPIAIVTTIKPPDAYLRGPGVVYAIPAAELRSVFPALTIARMRPAPHSGTLSPDERHRLAKALVACGSMQTTAARDLIYADLPFEIRIRIGRSNEPMAAMRDAVSVCERYEGALLQLLDAVHRAEADSIPWIAVEQCAREIGLL